MKRFLGTVTVLTALILTNIFSGQAAGCWLCHRCRCAVVPSAPGVYAAPGAPGAAGPWLANGAQLLRPIVRGALQIVANDTGGILDTSGSVDAKTLAKSIAQELLTSNSLSGGTQSLGKDVDQLKADVKQLQADVKQLQADVRQLHADGSGTSGTETQKTLAFISSPLDHEKVHVYIVDKIGEPNAAKLTEGSVHDAAIKAGFVHVELKSLDAAEPLIAAQKDQASKDELTAVFTAATGKGATPVVVFYDTAKPGILQAFGPLQ